MGSVDLDSSILREWLVPYLWVLPIVIVVALVCLGIALGFVTNVRRSDAFASALGDSTRSRLRWLQPPGSRGFAALFAPAPEPFVELSVTFRAATRFSPLDLLARILHQRRQELHLHGKLKSSPTEQIIWVRSGAPGQAVGRGSATTLWVQRRLDFVNGEYAVQGANTSALEHRFSELQTRFGAFLDDVRVQANGSSPVALILDTTGLDNEEIPALVATIRNLARAALQQ